jgi:hypothetical protein
MREVLSDDERRCFEEHLRPRTDAGRGDAVNRAAAAYLHGA